MPRRPPRPPVGLDTVDPAPPGEDLPPLPGARLVPLDRIHPNPEQPRQAVDDERLEELAASIRERGVLEPLRLRPLPGDEFEIIAGERRYFAAGLAGLDAVPAIVVERDEAEAYLEALAENVHREDLNPLDLADALRTVRRLCDLDSWDAVAAKVGLSRATVYRLLALDELPPAIRNDVRTGALGTRHVQALRSLDEWPDVQAEAYRRIVDEELPGERALALARELRPAGRPRRGEPAAPPLPVAATVGSPPDGPAASGASGDGCGDPVLEPPPELPPPDQRTTDLAVAWLDRAVRLATYVASGKRSLEERQALAAKATWAIDMLRTFRDRDAALLDGPALADRP